ncbi:MAG: hypothetical protein FNT15_07550 [Sulfurovum sp.]|nr:MAG: hypothetical protein FNT15_07550 [Sulfurovum sp.]
MKKFITIFSVIAFAYANAEVVKDEAYYIKKHIIIGSDAHEECVDGEGKILFDIDEKEFALEEKVLYEELKRQNYKFLSQKEFERKIYQFFGLKLNPNSNVVSCMDIYPLDGTGTPRHKECFENQIAINWLSADSTVISKNKRFITELYRFPEIVNYQKKYPYLLKMEKRLKKFEPCELGDKRIIIKINRWKDVPQYGKIVQKNLDNFVNLNNYLFNDDKSKIPQVFNDNASVFANLVSEYGYTKDKDLLNWYNKEFKQNIKVGEKLELKRDAEWFHREENK